MPPTAVPIRRRPSLVWLALAVLAAALALLVSPPAAAQTLRITSALAAAGEGDSFPAGVRARSVVLPDDWSARPDGGGPVWYRVAFNAPVRLPLDDLTALYVERACTTLEVYLNGQIVHSGGRLDEPQTNHCGHPQLVTLPSALIAPGLNTLDIRLAGLPLAEVGSRWRAGSLSALELGPQSLLMPRYERQQTFAVALPQALSATLLLMGGFMFVLGTINRRESHLAYFGALSIGWALLDARLWLRTLPVDRGMAEFLSCSLLAFIALAGVQFLLRYARHRSRLADRLLPLQCLAMPASLAVAGHERLHAMTTLWTLVFAVEVAAAAAFYLRSQWRAQSRASWVMAATLATLALAGGVEFVAQQLGGSPGLAQAARLVAPLMFVVVGLRLVQQHGRALQEAELGRAHLEQRVREATAEIERNFRQLAELRVEQVTERERKRIAADLHDDLGAKLLTIVHTSDDQRISTLAREALEEMRLSVRGLTGKAVRLADALGDWRAEVVNRLAQAGIHAEWSAPEDLPQTLSARAFVQTTRILREATSNIIKHSGATHCSVSCRVAEGDFQLVIQDDGHGIPMEMDGRLDRGHGMMTMKHRAKQLQGQCLVESSPGYGTVIRLAIPLDRAVEAAAR